MELIIHLFLAFLGSIAFIMFTIFSFWYSVAKDRTSFSKDIN